jgi:integrase
MASIRKTESGKYKVNYTAGNRRTSKTFRLRSEAKAFVESLEGSTPENFSLGAVMRIYAEKVTPNKRGERAERLRIGRWLKRPLAEKPVSSVTRKDVEDFIRDRNKEPSLKTGGVISASTVIKEVALLSSVFRFAIANGWATVNPCEKTKLPKQPEHRERVATKEDTDRLLLACGWDGAAVPESLTQLTVLAFMLGCATGMRSGEMLKIEESWIEGNVLHIPKEATKTYVKRDIGLSEEALRLLGLVIAQSKEVRIFHPLTDKSRDVLFRKVRDKAGLGPVTDSEGRMLREGLSFHDSRASFCTWASSPDPKTGAPRLDVLALARQTGHKNLKMLQRYYRASASEIAERLQS